MVCFVLSWGVLALDISSFSFWEICAAMRGQLVFLLLLLASPDLYFKSRKVNINMLVLERETVRQLPAPTTTPITSLPYHPEVESYFETINGPRRKLPTIDGEEIDPNTVKLQIMEHNFSLFQGSAFLRLGEQYQPLSVSKHLPSVPAAAIIEFSTSSNGRVYAIVHGRDDLRLWRNTLEIEPNKAYVLEPATVQKCHHQDVLFFPLGKGSRHGYQLKYRGDGQYRLFRSVVTPASSEKPCSVRCSRV